MTIFIGSRYENERPFAFRDARTGQVKGTVLSTRFPVPSASYRYHLWSQTDRIDRVAEQYLGNADNWWYLMDANPDYLNPMDIAPGSIIRIPGA